MSGQPDWQCAFSIKEKLVQDGWYSPDTYSNEYKKLIKGAAVYLFLLHNNDSYKEAFVAYVGMSTQLKQRMSGHPILADINQTVHWPMRWFKPTKKSSLRAVEATLIAENDPPWNIQGRTRGVILP